MNSKPDSATPSSDEEQLVHALVSRGLLTADEAQQGLAAAKSDSGPQALLARLVQAGFLTARQAQRAEHELAALLAQQIPGYHLLEKLGQGAMGTVYKARQVSMNRLVAVKVLLPRLAANPEYLRRFTREARLAARLSHNNIVQAIDVASAGTVHFFVMEYVEGTTIQEELNRSKVYGEKDALAIILQLAHALQHAHRRHLIHRDIKPANIILTAERTAKLADLGMAREAADERLTRAEKGLTVGTPLYIAPEQIGGRAEIDGRADIYSLGGTFYHMVTGRPPFAYTSVEPVLQAHLKEALVPAHQRNKQLSSGLSEVIETMMAKDRAQRYQTPGDLIMDLQYLLAGQAPRLARQQIATEALQELTAGETEEEEEDEDDDSASPGRMVAPVWVGIVGALLAVSVIVNVVLLLKR